MSGEMVTVVLHTADKTRKAQVTVPRSMFVKDIIKASTKRWFLSFGRDYVVCNMTRNRQLLPSDSLSSDNAQNGDVLMIQPLATHGAL